MPPPNSSTETSRLEALERLQVLDTEPEEAFDALVRTASLICETPVSLISLVDGDRQWFKARVGVEVAETSREMAFCAHAIEQDGLMEVRDAMHDARFADNELVTGAFGLRFYAGVPLALSDGARVGTICVIDHQPRSLTERQREALRELGTVVVHLLERRRRDQERQVAEHRFTSQLGLEQERKNRFIATLAHELRSPLSVVKNGLRLLRMPGLTDEKVAQVLAMMERQTSGMSVLAEGLLDLASISQGKIELHLEPVDLVSVLTHALEIAAPLIEARGHELHVDVPQVPVVVRGDPGRLTQVLSNLLTNAAKYTPDGGRIQATVSRLGARAGSGARIVIQDSGVGLTAEQTQSIFGMFEQGFDDAAMRASGLGIGLALAQRLSALHGGDLSASSDGRGQGSTFTLVLPP